MGLIKLKCAYCGKEISRYESQVTGNNCCSRECMNKWRSKEHNPEHYPKHKNSPFKYLNAELNKTRMTPEVREKLRNARLGSGEGKSYEKTYGRHTHRVVAEQMLGRPLKKGEVVHHIDCNKRNNAPENLMVFSSQSEHVKWHAEHDRRWLAHDIYTTRIPEDRDPKGC